MKVLHIFTYESKNLKTDSQVLLTEEVQSTVADEAVKQNWAPGYETTVKGFTCTRDFCTYTLEVKGEVLPKSAEVELYTFTYQHEALICEAQLRKDLISCLVGKAIEESWADWRLQVKSVDFDGDGYKYNLVVYGRYREFHNIDLPTQYEIYSVVVYDEDGVQEVLEYFDDVNAAVSWITSIAAELYPHLKPIYDVDPQVRFADGQILLCIDRVKVK